MADVKGSMFFPDPLPPLPQPSRKKSKLYTMPKIFLWAYTIFHDIISDTWRFVIAFALSSIIYVSYVWMPFNILAFVISVVILYKFGYYKVVLHEKIE